MIIISFLKRRVIIFSMSTNSSESTILPITLTNIQRQMMIFGMPLLLCFGVGGNLMNCAVFLRKKLRSNSCSIYLISSSVSHTILLIWAMSTNLYTLNYLDPLTYSVTYCRMRAYLISSLFMISRSYIVLACVDRYALCSTDVRVRNFCRCRVAIRLVPVVVGIWLVIPCHLLIFNTVEKNRCIMPGLYNILYAVYAVICAGILPPTSMLIFGLLARRNLRLMKRRIAPVNSSGEPQVRFRKVDHQIMKVSGLFP